MMKSDYPAITVIIPMYNATKYIEQAVDSILNQSFKDLSVMVIDDCSTDGSYEFVQSRYGDNPRVQLVSNKKNSGPIATRNLGFRLSNSKYIALLDNDDVMVPGVLEAFYNIAENQKADVVSSYGLLHSRNENIPRDFSGQFIPEIFGTLIKQPFVIAEPTPPHSDYFQTKIELYLKGEFGLWCAFNKLYSRKFLMENNIFFTPTSHERGFTFKCMLYAQTYVKMPMFMNIYREGIQSASRRPPSFDIVSGKPRYFSRFAADFSDIMKDFDFFKENPVYKYRVIDMQLSQFDPIEVLPYYPDSQTLSPELIKTFDQIVSRDFGENALFIEWIFHQYHLLYRRNLELMARIKQLEAPQK